MGWAVKLVSAYVIAQVTVGVQIGMAIAFGVVVHQMPIVALSAALMPFGLLLLAVQYPLAATMVHGWQQV